MSRFPAPDFFGGGSNRLWVQGDPSQFAAFDPEETHNLYLEVANPGQGNKSPMAWIKRPGLRARATIPGDETNTRTLFYQDGRTFGVTGESFWEIDVNDVVTVWGTMTATSNQASIVSNGSAGHQLLICDGHFGYVFDTDTNTFTQINVTNFPGTGFPDGDALCVEFIDGYGIVLQRNSRKFFTSALEDFTSWDPLDVYERSEGSDNLTAVRRNRRELWFPGTLTGEVWFDSGDALTPFQPVPGVFRESGATGAQAFIRFGDENASGTVAWIALGENGGGSVYLADGYQAKRVSTTAVDRDLQSVTDLTFSFLFAFQWQGHNFLCVLQPELSWSYIYDLALDRWFKWSEWNTTTAEWEVWLPSCHVLAFGDRVGRRHLVGTRTDGVIYEIDRLAFDDAVAV